MYLPGYLSASVGYTIPSRMSSTPVPSIHTNWKYRIDGSGTSYQIKENVKLDSGKLLDQTCERNVQRQIIGWWRYHYRNSHVVMVTMK